MKSFYVRDLAPNQVMTSTFLVHTKDIRQKKSGEPFLSLLLGDRTGDVDAKMWDNVAEVMDTFERDDFVKVKGLLQIFQNRPQLTIHKMMRVEDTAVDLGDYFPSSDRSPDEMFAELRGVIASIQNPHFRSLLEAFMDDEKIARMYRTAPAAKSVHHAYLGGLIEHVLSLCQLCRATAAHYRNVDVDLLLTGAILHDVGKISELTYERTFGYSNDGQLLGHIIIGLRMVDEKISRFPDFPVKLRMLLDHMILSHHGELEFGSPKVPVFPEALLLHHLDNLDSKMECMRAAVARDRNVEGCWTTYNSALDRSVLKKARFVGDEGVAAPPAKLGVEEPLGQGVQEPDTPGVTESEGQGVLEPATSGVRESGSPGVPEANGVAGHEAPVTALAAKLKQAWRGN